MCFFKTLQTPPTIPSEFAPPQKQSCEEITEEWVSETDFVPQQEKQSAFLPMSNSNAILMSCLGLVNFNSQMLSALDEKLNEAERVLNTGHSMLATAEPSLSQGLKRNSTQTLNSSEKLEQNLFKSEDKLVSSLFGTQGYKYRLVLDGDFSTVLYKDRNFNMSVKLVDIASGKQQLNGNIVNICLGVCDNNAEWVHDTKEGLPFLKGKIEAELYHGTAGFAKMAARDVSRIFPDKEMNLVVYPKPTVLKYSGGSSIEEQIDYSQIEPLVVHNVCVKAKKRE